jgi:hypothetical protein
MLKPTTTPSPPTEGITPTLATKETLQQTLAEIAQRRKDGHCFHCHDMFTNDYKKVCK